MPFEDALHSQQLYDPTTDDITTEQEACMERLYDYNATRPSEGKKRVQMLHEMLAECGENCWIEPPFHANWGGRYIHFGNNIYANFGLTCVDDTHIYVGNDTLFGPNCVLATANHPILPSLRARAYQYNLPIHIGRCCWLGAGVIVVPGVTIGDNTVIGAGSVVTKDIPANVVAAGNPCRVLREIGPHDREYFYRDRKINWESFPEDVREGKETV